MRKKAVTTSAETTKDQATRVTIFDYDESQYAEKVIPQSECAQFKEKPTVTWINVDGLSDKKAISDICKCFGLSEIVRDMILDIEQRPKIEDHGDHLFIIMKMFLYNKETSSIISEQVSMVVGKHYVLTFKERVAGADVFDPVRKRIRTAGTRIRRSGTDYLAYRVIDAVIDYYFSIMEIIGEDIENLEEMTIKSPDRKSLVQMQKIRREMINLRKSLWPVREVLNSLYRGESSLITNEVRGHIRDVYENTIQMMDTVDTYRDMMSSLLDIYLSSLSNRLNEVMKVLTIISTIFMPLTFLTGIYGMNFVHMPEIGLKYSYLIWWIVVFIITAGMLFLFKKRKWM